MGMSRPLAFLQIYRTFTIIIEDDYLLAGIIHEPVVLSLTRRDTERYS
jgi:hypothetical protein